MEILSFQGAMDLASHFRHKHVILGNGFSIALEPDIFSYGSLLDSADFSAAPHVSEIFDAYGTQDFEVIIKTIVDAAMVLSIYDPKNRELLGRLECDANIVKEALVKAVALRHPDKPYDIDSKQYAACRYFLNHFKHIYTLNYDVLLYWALMNADVDDIKLTSDDGFRHPDREEAFVTWQEAQSATVHFLHGALHLFDSGPEILKYTWSKTDIPIVEQIRQSLDEDKFPLFVAEGDSESKLSKIMHSAYLHKGLRSLESCADNSHSTFVVFGHSLAENDMHVLKRIGHGKTPLLLVSLYRDPDSPENKEVLKNADWLIQFREQVNSRYPLQIEFYDSESAHVWG